MIPSESNYVLLEQVSECFEMHVRCVPIVIPSEIVIE
jgi:hypothetical protein